MKKSTILFVSVLMLSLASCRMNSYVVREVDVDRHNIAQTDNAVKVIPDYKKPVSAMSQYQRTYSAAVNEAVYLCLTGNNAVDVVVDPIFYVEYHPLRLVKRYRATMNGYAGTYEDTPAGVESTKGFTREQIENYKLFSDPNFAKYMYGQSGGDYIYLGDVVNQAPQRPSLFNAASKTEVKAKKDKKGKLSISASLIGMEVKQ